MISPLHADPISAKPWNSILYRLPAFLKSIPTMLTDEEGRMLSWVAEFDYSGAGAICELGSFVGGSTARLASGLSKNAKSKGVIHAFDRFECAENMKKDALYKHGIEPFNGVDILPLSQKLLSQFSNLIVFHKGDIAGADWNGGPIELLFVDISKSTSTADHVCRTFFPHLIAGRSLVIHQDYFHHLNPWNAVQMELLCKHFDLVGFTESNSALFRCKQAIDGKIAAEARWNSVSHEERIALIRRAMGRFQFLRQREFLARMLVTVSTSPEATRASQYGTAMPARKDLDRWLAA